MSTTAPATNTPPGGAPRRGFLREGRRYTLQQNLTVIEFCKDYGIEPGQISFDGEGVYPIFDFEALSVLTLALSDIQDIDVDLSEANEVKGFVIARCVVMLADGRTRKGFAAGIVGEVLHDAYEVLNLARAMEVARARAMRVGLRMAGFDPIRAHNEKKSTGQTTLDSPEDQRVTELRQIHVLAHEFGLIDGSNKGAYYQIMDRYFPGVKSSTNMIPEQRAQFIAMLRAWINAKGVAVDLDGREQDVSS